VERFTVQTSSQAQMLDVTREVQAAVTRSGVADGICMAFVPHTTAGITINENADPAVKADVREELGKIVPFQDGYRHLEGNSAAHIKASMMGSSCLLAVENGRLVLGTWQGIWFCEFDGPRTRQVWVKAVGGR
jgi:secondary thiamine-phosphate synthase enzyme